ncbi:hypothetical protein KP509_26G018000 [Ceratopteris richardii]|uniref:Uncharacterized protein n=1 Tax=Ceratopteris richardii TaxID=49495 RepID=A0A8T2RK23_CERRI|nr:hypothetical protein KP509_26G018000 [Ceratopteris richardii]
MMASALLYGSVLITLVPIITVWLMKRTSVRLHIPSLHGKHVLITGASSGIGFALALECLRQGAFVTLIGRDFERLSRAADILCSSLNAVALEVVSQDRILLKVADVSNAEAITTAVMKSHSWRPIDVLVCNAGITINGLFDTVKISDLDMVTRVNFLGCVYTIHAAIPLMKARSKNHPCSIAIMGSLAGLNFVYGANVYAATKHALKGLAEVLRFELMSDNIKVSIVCPGFTATPMLDTADEHFWRANKMFFFDEVHPEAADVVAARTIEAVKAGKFLVTTDPSGLIPRVLGRGMTPAESLYDAIIELILLVPLRIISHCWFIYAKWYLKRHQ